MNIKNQQRFFDQKNHRFNDAKLLTPPYAQLLELIALEQSLKLKPASTIIDFGAGNGRVSLYFLKKGHNVIAIDISKRSLRELETIYSEHKTSSWGTLTTRTSLPAILADAIVGADILHHVSIQEVLPKLTKVLRRDGTLSFSEPNAWHLLWYIHYWLSRIPWDIEKNILQCTYFNLFTLFQNAQFSHVSIIGHGLLPTTPLSAFHTVSNLNVVMGNLPLLRFIAFRYIIRGVKK